MSRLTRRQFKIWAYGLLTLGAIVFALVCTVQVRRGEWLHGRIKISPETTVFDGPLMEDGRVDYHAALNEIASKGVTPENNAAVLLWQALGPDRCPAAIRDAYFKELGMEVPPPEGTYLISFNDHRRSALAPDASNEAQEIERQNRDGLRERAAAVTPWSKERNPDLAAWVKRNESALDLLVEASRRSRFYDPLIRQRGERLASAHVPACRGLWDCVPCLCGRAMQRLYDGEIEGCWSDLLASHRLTRLLAQGQTSTHILCAWITDRTVSDAEQALLQAQNLHQQVLRMRDDFDRLAPWPDPIPIVIIHERCLTVEVVAEIAQYGIEILEEGQVDESEFNKANLRELQRLVTNAVFDWDVVIHGINLRFDRVEEALRLPTVRECQSTLDQLRTEDHALRMRLLAPGDISAVNDLFDTRRRSEALSAGLLFATRHPSWNVYARGNQTNAEVRKQITATGLALAAYHAQHAEYPEQLETLVPEYLDELPIDPYSGEPLRYRRQGADYLLYSLGKNGRDDTCLPEDSEVVGDDFGYGIVPELITLGRALLVE